MQANIDLFSEICISVLLVSGGLLTVVSAFGLAKFMDIFERIHAPAILASLVNWCFIVASIWFFIAAEGRFLLGSLLIGIFLAITAPVSSIFLMRASLFRRRNIDKDIS